MAFVEVLDRDLLQRVRVREHDWAQRFERGLEAPYDYYFGVPVKTVLDSWGGCFLGGPFSRDTFSWGHLFVKGFEKEKKQRELIARSGQGYIPGIPNQLVEEHIWPRVAKYFRDISAAQHAEKETILSTLYSIRLLNKQWKHLVDFSYEWSVYRMVRRDFSEGWVWYSYYPTLKGPLTEFSRMMDLLPDPFALEEHKSMGVLPTNYLWIWRYQLNKFKLLRYDDQLHCGRDMDYYYHGINPCYDCRFYPRLLSYRDRQAYTFGDGEEDLEFS